MEKTAILHADILDIIFEGRNKEYGAYELRRTYNRRLRISVAVMLSLTLMLCIGQLIAGRLTDKEAKLALVPEDAVLKTVEIPEEPEPLPPPPAVKTPPPVQTIAVTPPRIMPDEQVPETEVPPVEDQEDAKIDLVTQDGDKDVGIVAPPVEDGDRGIVDKPKPVEDDKDKIWISVQKESEYPGGMAAWTRFLKRQLNYPQLAVDNQIQGTVWVQFVVDREGNVSNVQAVSGPVELRDEAIRVIRKSGKWVPALQNGNHVPSYKKQPIGFQLMDE
jgi:periplasmic protein TonB